MFDQLFFLMLSGVFLYSARVSRQRLQYAQMMYLGHNPSKWEVLFNTLMMSSACAAIASSSAPWLKAIDHPRPDVGAVTARGGAKFAESVWGDRQ